MRILSFAALLGFLLVGCASTKVLEVKENRVGSLMSADEYSIRPITVSFSAPEAWATTPEQWNSWVAVWRTEYETNLRANCRKTLTSIDAESKPDKGYVVECDIYEMSSGGFAGVGGRGYARARLFIYDGATRNVLFDGKIEGTASSQTKAADRLTAAVGDVAAKAAEILMQGA